jgi:hypothetical protein
VSVIDLKQEKWFKKAIAGFRKAWVTMVKKAESFEAYAQGISAVTGIPVDVVRSSLPAVNWKEFQANAERYLPAALQKIEAAYRAGKWKIKYVEAFRTPG